MRTIGSHDDQIHFRAQVNEVSRPLAALSPEKASGIVERDWRKKRDAGRNIPNAEPDLGNRRQEILLRVAAGLAG